MSTTIATKYGAPCLKCGDQIKAGSLVNWDRGHGIWHLNKGDSYCLEVDNREEVVMSSSDKVVSSSNNDGMINISNLIKALQGMTEKEISVKPTKSLKKERKQTKKGANEYSKHLTAKQISFCELIALGSNRTDAYFDSYELKNYAFASNAGRKLLEQKKIRDKIAKFRNDLTDGDNKSETQNANPKEVFESAIRSEGVKGGWAFCLTTYQERFCRAMASGATRLNAFSNSGFVTTNWSKKRMRREANNLMEIPKIKIRIANLMSGDAPNIKASVAGENSHKEPRSMIKAKGSVEVEVPSQQSVISEDRIRSTSTQSAANSEFVENFVELIKAHGRLLHHAVVTRGQKEVGIPGADPIEVEEAVYRSIKTLRETLNAKLSNKQG